MAPPPKRKRSDRDRYGQDQNDSPNRPSPHRPQNLPLGQQQGNRRGSRSGTRGGSSNPNSPSVAHPSPSTMPPPTNSAQSSRSQLPSPSTTGPSADSTEEKPAGPTVPESNQYLTQDRVSAWSSTGRIAVVQAATTAQLEDDMLTLSLVFEEVVQSCLDRTLSAEILGSMVRDIVAAPAADTLDPVSCFLDTVSSLTETESNHAALRQMLVATGIDTSRMRGELENSLLISLDLVRNTFSRVAIRKATHALYRQSNYNLLREEAEGYAKLMTEYFTTVHSEPPSQEVVNETLQRMNALIGAFDLDVGRVLDVTLDVFANLLVKHTRFFVKFLRSSPWWPKLSVKDGIEWTEPMVSTLPRWALPESDLWYYTDEEKIEQFQLRDQRDIEFWKSMGTGAAGIKAFFELGARRISSDLSLLQSEDLSGSDSAKLSEKEKMNKWSDEYMAKTSTLPPLGNPDAAQLLGFKLRFYASDARDAHDTLPDNLINLAALLIKIGFISLVDLYPHLYPEYTPEQKQKLKDAKKEKETKGRGKAMNALTMAAALPDEGHPQSSSVSRLREAESKPSSKPESERTTPLSTEEPKEKLPEPVDQKVALLRSLLSIGAIPEAMFILGRDPWLLDVYPDLRTYLLRLAHHALSKVYEWARPFPQQQAPFVPKQGISGTAASQNPRAVDYPPRRTLRWAKLEEKDAGDGIDYRFYWDDWADNVPICQDVDDVFRLSDSLLSFIGLECGADSVLLTKLARIGKKSLAEDSSPSNQRRWIEFCSTFLCPALTFSGQNPGIVNEVWDLLKQFDTGTRYAVYASWFGASKPALRAQFTDVTTQTKNIMKRISSENTKAMGRAMAKLAYASPGVVFESALKQAQGYGNMIDTLIECSRYLTYLGYDCLTWTLLKSFNSGRNAVQGDGMLAAHWARNTAMFVGKSYKRYSLMDPTPILECVAYELMKGKGNLSTLPMLEQIVTSMAGIVPGGALTESQVLAINAGPRLRAFTLEHYLGDHRHEGKGPQKRLLKVLMESGKSQLAPVILVALALEIQRYIYRPDVEDVPMKVLTANLDSLQSHFAQYLDLLRYGLSVQDFDAAIPGVVELMAEYGIDTPIAFTIARQSISFKVKTARLERRTSAVKTKSDSQRVETNGDVVMEGSDSTPVPNGVMNESQDGVKKNSVVTDDTDMKDATPSTDIDSKDSSTDATVASIHLPGYTNPAIEELALGIRSALPDLYGKHPCLTFLITFWELSLVDMFSVISMKEYTNASNFFIEKSKALGYDRRNKDIAVQREAFDVQIKSLRAEADEMSANASHTRTHLREEMQQWFNGIPMVDERSDFLHETLLEECFLPRARISSEDAQFASAMLKFMHKAGVPGFRTMKLLDQLFKPKAMGERITLCTPRESQSLGRFLNDVLKELNTWQSSRDKFTSAAQGQQERLPGFGRTFNADRTPSTFVSYDDFRHVLYKWHTQFFKALEECLNSGDYTKIRNAINLLKAVSPTFPKIDTIGKSLHQIIKNMSETEMRGDLKLAATSLLGDFKKSEKFWISEQSFHPKSNSTNGATSEKSKAPTAQESAAAKLNATANTFNSRTGSTNGASKSPAKGRNEHEDGEVADRRSTAPAQQDAKSTMQLPNRTNDSKTRGTLQETKPLAGPVMHSSHSAAVSGRPDSRGSTMHPSRVPHALPSKPDTQPLRRPPLDRPVDRPVERGAERPVERPTERPIDRPVDRSAEYHSRGRDGPPLRGNLSAEYGRPDRDSARDSFPDRRGPSPARRERTRSPDRGPNTLDRRDFRGREFNDRSMPPPREAPRETPRSGGRGPGWGEHLHDPRDVRDSRDPRDQRDARDSRDHRDSRDVRERVDSRGLPLPPSLDNRTRMHPGPSVPTDDTNSYRRDFPPKSHPSGDRVNIPSRAPLDRPPTGPPSASDRGAPPIDRSMVNPDRAALITHDDRGRADREPRRDRASSPRRGDERAPAAFNGRVDASRDHGDERTPPQPFPANRDRREEPVGSAPTGPRGGRVDVTSSASARISREMFQPTQVSRPAVHQAQDPNYGRLNAPSETIPSGPRNLTTDRRDSQVHPTAPPPPPPPPPPPAPPVAPATGVHPSRLTNISRTSPIQTDVPSVPSGPRNLARTPLGPAGSPVSRGFPTGPASNDRNVRGQDSRNPLRAINSVLTQNAPSGPDRPSNQNTPNQSPQIRGRGANRASGLDDPNVVSGSTGPQSHPGTPNAFRPEGQHPRPDKFEQPPARLENHSQDDGRLDSRGHRESRRSERSGREHGRSQDRGERKPESERSARTAPEDRSARPDEQERASDRERGSGREKRSSDRDGSRRDRDRGDGDRTREGRERRDRGSGRGGAEDVGSRRGAPPASDHRSGDTRGRGGSDRKDDRDRRSRDDGRDRKRGRGPEDPHGDHKRSRPSGGV